MIFSTVLIAGCVSIPSFHKPGQPDDQRQLMIDDYDCQQQSGAAAMDNYFTQRQLYWQCMTLKKGYVAK